MPLLEVKDRFLKDKGKQEELEVLLSAQDCQQTEPGIIDYGANISFIDVVRVRFSKEGKMTSIQCHEGSADGLERRIDDAIYVDHGRAVGRKFIFTNVKIVERFRVNDSFQLIPVPPGSPELGTLVGDHPAILEYSYNKSSHSLVDMHRRAERADELLNILSAFVFGGISWINNRTKHRWVSQISEGCNISTVYRQEFYHCEDWEKKDDLGFSVLDNISEMPLVEAVDYFEQLGIRPDSTFRLPNAIREYFRQYESLSPKEKAMARLSAHWLQKSSAVHSASISLSFSAIVFAFESLINAQKRSKECEACDQVVYEKSISHDLPPDGPSFITRVCGLDLGIRGLQVSQARRARRPQISQASGARSPGSGCRAMSAA